MEEVLKKIILAGALIICLADLLIMSLYLVRHFDKLQDEGFAKKFLELYSLVLGILAVVGMMLNWYNMQV